MALISTGNHNIKKLPWWVRRELYCLVLHSCLPTTVPQTTALPLPFSFDYNWIFSLKLFETSYHQLQKSRQSRYDDLEFAFLPCLQVGWNSALWAHNCVCNTHRLPGTQSLHLLSSQNLEAQIISPCTVKWFKVFIPSIESEPPDIHKVKYTASLVNIVTQQMRKT